jgi:type IV pilus assembly protein PilV
VLSVGLVSIAGLQLSSKRSNFEAVQRYTATTLAQDVVERMRADPQALDYYTNFGAGRVGANALTGNTIAAITCAGAAVTCTEDQLAQYDLYEFEQALTGVTEQQGGQNTGGLTLPMACIIGPNGGSGNYRVAIAWRGLTRLSNPTISACGQGSGRYDDAAAGAAGNDVYRRLLVIDTYIELPAGL